MKQRKRKRGNMETNKIEVEIGKFLFQFASFDNWVNTAERSFADFELIGTDRYICIDNKGRICRIGREFMRARDDSSFPVKVYLKTF